MGFKGESVGTSDRRDKTMYKTNVEVQRTVKELITVEMNGHRDNVNVYVRGSVDCQIVNEAAIDIPPEGFINLVYPILKARGYTLSPESEGF